MKSIFFLLFSFFVFIANGQQQIVGKNINVAHSVTWGSEFGDFDGDGDMDNVCLIDRGGNAGYRISLSVSENDGNNVFSKSKAIDFFVYNPYFSKFSVADFNNDGLNDIFYDASQSGVFGRDIVIYLNEGNFLFKKTNFGFKIPTISTDPTTASVLSDFNGDNFIDIIIPGTDTLYVFKNIGNGTFVQEKTKFSVGKLGSYHIDKADFDKDGDLDLLVSIDDLPHDNYGNFYWLENKGSFSFVSKKIEIPSFGIRDSKPQLADLDLDGNADLIYITCNCSYGKISIYKGDANGSFSFWKELTSYANFRVADFNGDGRKDIQVSYLDFTPNPRDSIFINTVGGFNGVGLSYNNIINSGFSIEPLDLDLDGNIEFVSHRTVPNSITAELFVYNNTPDYNFTLPKSIIGSRLGNSIDQNFADMDEDGDLDIVQMHKIHGFVQWMENKGNNEFYGTLICEGIEIKNYTDILPIDYDKDGHTDLILTNPDNTLVVYKWIGFNKFQKQFTINNNAVNIMGKDLNKDGFDDLVYISGGFLSWQENLKNGTFKNKTNISSIPNFNMNLFELWDWDKDNDLDIVTCFEKKLSVFKNNGSNVYALETREAKNEILALADFNYDGFLDYYCLTEFADSSLFNIFNGTNFQGIVRKRFPFREYSDNKLFFQDWDKDNDLDLITIWTDPGSYNIAYHENKDNLFSSFSSDYLEPLTSNSPYVHLNLISDYVADLDQNGFLDLCINNDTETEVYQHKGGISNYIVEGKVFFDQNNNKLLDSQEPTLKNQKIEIIPSGYSMITNLDGYYQKLLDAGTSKVKCTAFYPFEIDSILSIKYVTLPSSGTSVVNFPIDAQLLFTSITPTINLYKARCNEFGEVNVGLNNEGTETVNGYLRVGISNVALINQGQALADSISNGFYFYKINNLNPFETSAFSLYFKNKDETHVGEFVITSATVLLKNNLGIIYDSVSTIKDYEISCAYDPNDKLVFPKGEGLEKIVGIDQHLDYTIRFQNTGNDTARDVRIIDTLDVNLDINSINLLASSHPFTLDVLNKNILSFNFININLPDSNKTILGSQGFVNYSISPKSNIPIGTKVYNTANIIFDLNSPIRTNTTLSAFGRSTSIVEKRNIEINTFPNPFSTLLNGKIKFPSEERDVFIYLTSVDGKILDLQEPRQSNFSFNTAGLSKGFYFLVVLDKTSKQIIGSRKVVKE
jgi:uncharacterized repeat protein (TIGR01451 family)